MTRKSSLRVPKYNVCQAQMRRQLNELRGVRTMSMGMSLSDEDVSCSDLACSKVHLGLVEDSGPGDGKRCAPEKERATPPTEVREEEDAASVAGEAEQAEEEWRRKTAEWIEEEAKELRALLGESEALRATLETLEAREAPGEEGGRRRREEGGGARDLAATMLDRARIAVGMTRAAAGVWEELRDLGESAREAASIVLEKASVAVGMTQAAARAWEEMRDVLGEVEESATTTGKSGAQGSPAEEEGGRRRKERGGARGRSRRSKSRRRKDVGRSKSVVRGIQCKSRLPQAPQAEHRPSNGKKHEVAKDIFQDTADTKKDEINKSSLAPRFCRSSNRHSDSTPLTVRYIKSLGARHACRVEDGPPDLPAHRPTSREEGSVPDAFEMHYFDADGRRGVYCGQVDERLLPHGEGRIAYADGSVKEGRWREGRRYRQRKGCRNLSSSRGWGRQGTHPGKHGK